VDAAFALAYGAESPLGMPLVASKEALDAITPATLQSYVDSLYTAKRTVVAGVGISHDALVEQTVAQFGDMRSGAVVTKKASPYVGGTERMHVVDGEICCK
jgi:predicted Zn-dependent peptidase